MKTRTFSWTIALLTGLLFLASANSTLADVKMPAIFSDHMVLQSGMDAPVWGWAEPGEDVSVTIAGQTKTTKADAAGKWQVKLPTLKAGETGTLMVRGKNMVTINDVLVGEVWLCSGQSNMAMTVNRANDYPREQQAANFPSIRMFTVERTPNREPQADCRGEWEVCSPATVGMFSATAYFFGRELHQKLNVPVGLINSSYGGTDISAWTSMDVQKDVPELKPVFEPWDKAAAGWDLAKAKADYEKQLAKYQTAAAKAKADKSKAPKRPTAPVHPREDRNHPATLFNGMIAPLVPYAIRGAIWYQGERNASSDANGYRYRIQLPLLVNDWRTRWGEGDFPFAWVQLPNFTRTGDGWMLVRESMLLSLKVPNTGMAVTTDVGDPKDIHPSNKQVVGQRLAMWALAGVYQQKVAASGPLPAGHEIRGSEVILRFKHTDGGLTAKGGELKGFVIAGADKKWVPAQARIEGETVIVSSSEVTKPVAARFAWTHNPDANFYNGAGLPASPFRTDVDNVAPQP